MRVRQGSDTSRECTSALLAAANRSPSNHCRSRNRSCSAEVRSLATYTCRMSPLTAAGGIQPLLDTVAAIGGPFQIIVAVAAFALLLGVVAKSGADATTSSSGMTSALARIGALLTRTNAAAVCT